MPEADDATTGGGSWWRTLPGMFTAAAGLVTAVTGLIVAVEQLRPSHASSPPAATAAFAPVTDSSTPANAGAKTVSFPAGTTATANNGLRYDVVSAETTAGNPGQLALALHVKVTNPGQYDANFWSRTFRLRVGADTSAPTNSLDDIAPGGATKVGEVDFAVPADARQAILLVGDDYAHAVEVPLTLR